MENQEISLQNLHDKLISQVQDNKRQIAYMVSMQAEQGQKIDRIYNTLIGNGSSDSIVARLLIAEQHQKEESADRKELCLAVDKLEDHVAKLDKRSERDYRTIQELEKGQDSMSEKIETLTDTVNAWRNRAVGIGIGAGLGTSIIIYLLQQLIANAIP